MDPDLARCRTAVAITCRHSLPTRRRPDCKLPMLVLVVDRPRALLHLYIPIDPHWCVGGLRHWCWLAFALAALLWCCFFRSTGVSVSEDYLSIIQYTCACSVYRAGPSSVGVVCSLVWIFRFTGARDVVRDRVDIDRR